MATWQLDKAHTQINFSAKHMMVTTDRGTFHDVDGTIELDEADPTRSTGSFRVGAASVDTNFGARDAHLRSSDFFDVERYPDITFVSTAVRQTGEDTFDVTGDLTIRDVTKPITFKVQLEGIVKGMSGQRHVGLTASAVVHRADWGLDWNVALEQGGWLVGKDIKLDIVIAADEVAAPVREQCVGAHGQARVHLELGLEPLDRQLAVEPLRHRPGHLDVEPRRLLAALQAVERDVFIEADRERVLRPCRLAAQECRDERGGGDRPRRLRARSASLHHLPRVST